MRKTYAKKNVQYQADTRENLSWLEQKLIVVQFQQQATTLRYY
jgi:hypothetical protein